MKFFKTFQVSTINLITLSVSNNIKFGVKKVMKEMNVQPGSTALDVCCGTADWTIALSKAVGPSGEVTGLDFSENMLKVGEAKNIQYV